MSLPVLVVGFDGVVGSYLRTDAARLRGLFRYAEATPSVLVLDEIDALAQSRGNPGTSVMSIAWSSRYFKMEDSCHAELSSPASDLPRALDSALLPERFPPLFSTFPSRPPSESDRSRTSDSNPLGDKPGRAMVKKKCATPAHVPTPTPNAS